MLQVPENITTIIRSHVHRDLAPSAQVVFGKTAAAVGLGGFLSLYICGQFGFGMTPFATQVNHNLHHGVGGLVCALACGAIFAIMPALVLRLMTSPLQFRALLRKRWEAAAIWTTCFGSLLAWHGDMGSEPIYFASWLGTALVMYRLVGEIVDRTLFALANPAHNS